MAGEMFTAAARLSPRAGEMGRLHHLQAGLFAARFNRDGIILDIDNTPDNTADGNDAISPGKCHFAFPLVPAPFSFAAAP